MRITVMAVMLAMASVLLAAGLEKARDFASFVSTLRDLGLERGGKLAAAAVITIEIAVAAAILVRPGSGITSGAVFALATSFAIAGIIGMRRGMIRCSCFGPLGNGTLGKTQLFAFPFWIAGALLLSRAPAPDASPLALFAAAGLTLATVRLARALPVVLRARGDRRSAEEMYPWLR